MIDRLPIVIAIPSLELRAIKAMAIRAEIGGNSHIRERQDRIDNLSEDQLTGQLATYALHRYLYGDAWIYKIDRWNRNKNPYNGDGGYDVPGLNVDVKGSMVRTKLPLWEHRLAIRPAERHGGWVYVLALVINDTDTYRVNLMGWASDDMLPQNPDPPNSAFSGAFTIKANQLMALPPFTYKWLV